MRMTTRGVVALPLGLLLALFVLASCAEDATVLSRGPGGETLRWSAADSSLEAAQREAQAHCAAEGSRAAPEAVYSDAAVEIARFACR
jgi:hypothetical protein